MAKLKKYEKVQEEKTKDVIQEREDRQEPSGVACTEPGCEGEMMIVHPKKIHPELKEIRRAKCGKCGWLGWI